MEELITTVYIEMPGMEPFSIYRRQQDNYYYFRRPSDKKNSSFN